GRNHQPRRGRIIARKMLRLEIERQSPHLAPALQLHHPVGPPLRRAFWQRQSAGLFEDRAELGGIYGDGNAIAPGDLGERRAADIGPGLVERQIIVDGNGHQAAACSRGWENAGGWQCASGVLLLATTSVSSSTKRWPFLS